MTIHNMYAKRYVTFEYVPLIGHWSCTSALKLHCHVLAPIGAAKSGLDLPISHNVTTSPLCCTIQKWPDVCKFADRTSTNIGEQKDSSDAASYKY